MPNPGVLSYAFPRRRLRSAPEVSNPSLSDADASPFMLEDEAACRDVSRRTVNDMYVILYVKQMHMHTIVHMNITIYERHTQPLRSIGHVRPF